VTAALIIDMADDLDQDALDGLQRPASPCPVCGADGVCGYDAEGQAMIHAEALDEP